MVVVSLLSLDKRVTFVISFVCERLHIIGGVACPKPSAI